MWPKEHGAYSQLLYPLVTSLLVAGMRRETSLIALAAVAGFAAHEPLLVLLGRRGPRARREAHARAMVGFGVAAAVAAVAGAGAIWTSAPGVRWSFSLPLVPAASLAVAIALGRERTALGEITSALAFGLLPIPLCLSAGVSGPAAFSIGLSFAALFSASTLAVRVVILGVRGGGDPGTMRATQAWGALASACAVVGFALSAWRGALPWTPLLATAPGLVLDGVVAVSRPPAARLRTIGWSLVSATTVAAVILVISLSGH